MIIIKRTFCYCNQNTISKFNIDTLYKCSTYKYKYVCIYTNKYTNKVLIIYSVFQ